MMSRARAGDRRMIGGRARDWESHAPLPAPLGGGRGHGGSEAPRVKPQDTAEGPQLSPYAVLRTLTANALTTHPLQTHLHRARSSPTPRQPTSTHWTVIAWSRLERSNSSTVPQPAKLFTATYVRNATYRPTRWGCTG